MLTAFSIENYTRKGAGKLLGLLRRNRIRVEHFYCDRAAVKSVTYELRRGRVKWAAVDRFVKGERRQLLCPEGTELPAGYRRFDCAELSRRLCENAGLWLLRQMGDRRPSVVLIDDEGERAGLCSYLVECTDRVRVVTKNPRLYLNEADRILSEKGAAIRVSSGGDSLFDADLIIAPEPIDRELGCAGDAVILSCAPPLTPQNAPVISRYTFDLPEKYRTICPAYLDGMYFAAALYSLAGVHELGSSVFTRCESEHILHTRASLAEALKKRLQS
jgi:hypothetical protein